ncbi:MAG: 23S rRNA (uracil(1939)-C(5))-methyltransferase RlmD [bacterium]
MRRDTFDKVFEQVEIVDAGVEGKAVARIGERVIFVPFVVPGDVADIQVTKQRKQYWEGKAIRIHRFSPKRVDPFCLHFGTCGGCRWQNMDYSWQLFYKQKQVEDHLNRIGKFEGYELLPILPSIKTQYYRNKLEYTFSNRRWLVKEDIHNEESGMTNESTRMNALGFHIPGMFDRVLDIETCYLQEEPSNSIRLAVKKYALESGLAFYDVKNYTGFFRNLLIRTSSSGDLMVILVVGEDAAVATGAILDHLTELFPRLTSLYYVVNQKHNDSIQDLRFHLYKGLPWIHESMKAFHPADPDLKFRIGPTSFYQTNSFQAETLYRTVAQFGSFRGNEVVYDLYTGTGTIANYIARYVKHVVGIESGAPAVEDAAKNAELNGIQNVAFFTGEAEKILDSEFIHANGHPDVIVTDPPRAGMHEKVIRTILEIEPEKVVYVSCNSATQARDMALMKERFTLVKCQPVDMFPHTQHVENVALLERSW